MPRIKVKLRLDYVSKPQGGKLFAKNRNKEQLAEDTRQHKVSLFRNIPVQGIEIEDIDMSQDVYFLYDEIIQKNIGYAPVMISFYADSIEDAVKFSMQEEFRTIQILEPEEMVLSKNDLEHLIFKVSKELTEYREYLLRKVNS